MDQAITEWINAPAGSNAVLDMAMVAITQFGVPALVLLVIVQWWSRPDRARVRHTCVAAGLSFLIGLGLNQIILQFVHRIRPYDTGASHLIISPSVDWSFPSDHATAAFAITAAFLLHGFSRRGAMFLAASILVCVSRIYVGTHYFTDVVGGAATGIAAAIAVRMFYRRHTRIDGFVTGIF